MPRFTALLALLLVLPLASCDSGNDSESGSVTLMSQNLYLGADIFLLAQEPNPLMIPVRVAEVYGSALASDFPARAEAIADAIEDANPALIGLQEVTTYATQTPGDYLSGNTTPNATNVTDDFLQILLDALSARGLDYRVASVSDNADVEFPATTDGQTFFDVRYSDADVILARSDVQTSGAFEKSFDVLVTIPVGGVDQTFVRGFQRVDATVDGFSFAFVNTHLEVGGAAAPAQQLQAVELASYLRTLTGPVAFTGDINSAADGSTTNSYNTLTGVLTDAGTGNPEPTCCQDSDLLNATSQHGTRIDFVMHNRFESVSEYRAVLDAPETRVTSGGNQIWASDHAGVVATLDY